VETCGCVCVLKKQRFVCDNCVFVSFHIKRDGTNHFKLRNCRYINQETNRYATYTYFIGPHCFGNGSPLCQTVTRDA